MNGNLPENLVQFVEPEYPIAIYSQDGELIDRAGNVESAESVLYGDMSDHDGSPRTIYAPENDIQRLEYLAKINADCWNIPLDIVKPSELEPAPDEDSLGGMRP